MGSNKHTPVHSYDEDYTQHLNMVHWNMYANVLRTTCMLYFVCCCVNNSQMTDIVGYSQNIGIGLIGLLLVLNCLLLECNGHTQGNLFTL